VDWVSQPIALAMGFEVMEEDKITMNINNHKEPDKPKFVEVFAKIDKEHPSEEDIKQIQAYLLESGDAFAPDNALALLPASQPTAQCKEDEENESLPLQKLSRNLISNQIKRTFTSSEAMREQLDQGADELRRELGYENASTIEQLLIDEIILEFLRKHQMQLWLTTLTTGTKAELRTIKKASELASAAQNRFNKAVQALTNLRKAGIKVQVNIATEGGKQVNLFK